MAGLMNLRSNGSVNVDVLASPYSSATNADWATLGPALVGDSDSSAPVTSDSEVSDGPESDASAMAIGDARLAAHADTDPSSITTASSGTPETDSTCSFQADNIAHDDNDNAPIDDMENYEFSDVDGSSTTSVADLELDEDDDYDDVDNISNLSDDSASFERQVEADLAAEGDAVFDWNDEETYEYDVNWNTGQYNIGYTQSPFLGPMGSLHLSEAIPEMRMTQSAPSLTTRPADQEAFDKFPFSWTEANSSASSSSSSSSKGSPPNSPKMAVTGSSCGFEDDGDETELDEPNEPEGSRTVSNPGRALDGTKSYDPPAPRVLAAPPVHDPNAKDLPQPREVKVNPNKAVAFTIDSPRGKIVRYITPRGRSFKWVAVDSSRASSVSDSAPSSPTMIDYEIAMLHGNTRTGAHITDAVYGAIFKRAHFSATTPSAAPQPSLSNFYQGLMSRPSPFALLGGPATGSESMEEPIFEDELIDFEKCDPPSTTATPCRSVANLSDDMLPLHRAEDFSRAASFPESMPCVPTIANPMVVGEDISMSEVMAAYEARPTTPLQEATPGVTMSKLAIIDDSSSPRKRRLSDRSNDGRNVDSSPLFKKSRAEASEDALE